MFLGPKHWDQVVASGSETTLRGWKTPITATANAQGRSSNVTDLKTIWQSRAAVGPTVSAEPRRPPNGLIGSAARYQRGFVKARGAPLLLCLTISPSHSHTFNGRIRKQPKHRLTRLWAHVVQQLHHAFPLHGRPVFDGGAPSDLAVLLLDLWRAALGDEGAELAARPTTQKANCSSVTAGQTHQVWIGQWQKEARIELLVCHRQLPLWKRNPLVPCLLSSEWILPSEMLELHSQPCFLQVYYELYW